MSSSCSSTDRSFSFIATLRPDVADHLTLTGGEGLAGIAGETLEGFTVGVEDRFDNPLPQVEVKFTVIEGGGTLETEKATTDGDGYARAAAWRLGATPGTNQASASVAGIDPLLIRAEGLDSAKLKWYTLESIGELKVPGSGIDKGRIGLTPFNPCLCGKQQGFFLRDITYTGNPFIGRTSGSYLLDDAKLSTPTLWTWENGSITGGMLVFDAADPWDGEWTYTWVYREVEANGQ